MSEDFSRLLLAQRCISCRVVSCRVFSRREAGKEQTMLVVDMWQLLSSRLLSYGFSSASVSVPWKPGWAAKLDALPSTMHGSLYVTCVKGAEAEVRSRRRRGVRSPSNHIHRSTCQ